MATTNTTTTRNRASGAWLERAVVGVVFVLPLAFWPSLPRPFSVPKLWVLAGLACLLVGAEAAFLARPRWRPAGTGRWSEFLGWPLLAWPAAIGLSASVARGVSFEALALALVPMPVVLAILAGQVRPARVAAALAWSSTIVAGIAILQWFGLDPLRWLAWAPDLAGSPRLRVYGTLGNPNFTAAWLSATLPLVVPGHAREATARRSVALRFALQLAGIVATGSRAPLLAVPVIVGVALLVPCRSRVAWLVALATVAAAAWFSPARPIGVTVAGRYDLARATAAHLTSVPPAGHGPGTFESRYAGWRAEARPVDHAHNDYLEFWVEYGPVGLLAFVVACGWLAAGAWPPASRVAAASLAGAAGLLAIALVDFPLHRPAEWTLLWALLALGRAPRGRETEGATEGECGQSDTNERST